LEARAPIEEAGMTVDRDESYVRILESLCGVTDVSGPSMVVVEEVSRLTGCEAVGLRIFNGKDDFPFLAHRGFSSEFMEKEQSVCVRDDSGRIIRDEKERSLLRGMSGNVLQGRTDSALRCFTSEGSFWTGSLSRLIKDDRYGLNAADTDSLGGKHDFESIALVPLRSSDRIVGLIHACSNRRDRFTPENVALLEKIGNRIGAAFETAWRQKVLARFERECAHRWRGTETIFALGEMSATLAHELKTPLSGMMLSATRLKKALKTLSGNEKLVNIIEQLESSISTLSETVTHAARMIQEPKLELVEVDVNMVVEEALSLMEQRAAAQKVSIIREYNTRLPKIKVDSNVLMRALLNLIVNALDAMPSKGLLRVMTLESGKKDFIDIIISDTGPGIDPAEVESLFKPFSSKKSGGSGLGLAIVRKIVELHSGTSTLRRAATGGTEAIVTLPVGTERPDESEVWIVERKKGVQE
jgi:signal transduction histidine kinase